MTYRTSLAGCIAAIGILFGVVACEETDVNRTFEGPSFVRFTDTTVAYKESYSQPISIAIHNAGPALNEPITITYNVSGTAREGKDYSFVSTKGTVTIPANANAGTIQLKLINNANNILESQSLVFTITGVSPSSMLAGLNGGELGRKMTLIIEDDCLLAGTYRGARQAGAYVSLLGLTTSTATQSNIAINSASTDCKTYTVTNWNIGLVEFFGFNAIKPQFSFVDVGDNSLIIPAQANTELGNDTLSGTGAWNPQNRQLTFNLRWKTTGTLNGRDTTLLVTFPLTFTPQ